MPPGPIVIDVENCGAARGALLLINWPPEVLAQTIKPALDFEPYMSGGMLLARQTFRRLFRSERVDEREGLGIRQMTLLFTDLKGSTAMYERLGDLNAYALVRCAGLALCDMLLAGVDNNLLTSVGWAKAVSE